MKNLKIDPKILQYKLFQPVTADKLLTTWHIKATVTNKSFQLARCVGILL